MFEVSLRKYIQSMTVKRCVKCKEEVAQEVTKPKTLAVGLNIVSGRTSVYSYPAWYK